MSQISTIYDAVRLRMATLFPTFKELPYPSSIEFNDSLFLTTGWAVQIADAFNTRRLLSCQFSISRNITVTLTRQNFGLDRDIPTRIAAEKAILENHFTMVKDLEKDPDLASTLAKIEYQSDFGIQTLFNQQLHFLYIQSTFSIEYFENLN